MIKLRDYQTQLINDIGYEYTHGKRRVCAVAPCGAGKTITTGWMASATSANNKRVLFMVHRKELIEQTSETFTALNIKHGIISSSSPKFYDRPVQIASVQTLVKRIGQISAPDFIICDEAHHIVANTYKKIIDSYPNALLLGVTATPERLGGKGLGDIFESLVLGPTTKQLINTKNLCAYEYYAPPSNFDGSKIRVKYGEYVKEDVLHELDNNTVIGDIIQSYKKLANNKSAIVYCVSRDHSKHIAQEFNNAGITAMHIDGETQKMLREQAIREFKAGRVKILCNVDLISEGFDVPAMGAVILARPTQSLTLHIQQAMRSMRPDPNSPDKTATIIDHVGNVFRHGLPDDDRDWSLYTEKKKKQVRMEIIKTCGVCYQVFTGSNTCPYCGYKAVISRETMPEEKAGELVKIEEIQRKKEAKQQVGRARTIQELESIAIERGYSLRWVDHIAKAKNIPMNKQPHQGGDLNFRT